VVSVVRAFAIVVAHEGGEALGRSVEAVLRSGYAALRILVVDNASRDGACQRLDRADARVTVLTMARNLGFAGGVNAAVAHLEKAGDLADGDVLVLVNQDCIVKAEAIGALVTRVTGDARVGIVGARLLAPDGDTLQHAGGVGRGEEFLQNAPKRPV